MVMNPLLVWTAFFAPLVACILITLFLLRSKTLSSLTAIAGIVPSFICTLIMATHVFQSHHAVEFQLSLPWIQFDALTINFGFLVNPLAVTMNVWMARAIPKDSHANKCHCKPG